MAAFNPQDEKPLQIIIKTHTPQSPASFYQRARKAISRAESNDFHPLLNPFYRGEGEYFSTVNVKVRDIIGITVENVTAEPIAA